jgi:quercetin dioxygenase-like cupin family protein
MKPFDLTRKERAMIPRRRWLALAAAIACLASTQASTSPTPQGASSKKSRDQIIFSQTLPVLNGSHLKATLVEVTYAPGESSPPHSHPCPVMVYVLEGAVRSQVKGEKEAIYKAGESFYEAPNGVHQVSANASQTSPAKFLAYFICDHDTPLSVAPKM